MKFMMYNFNYKAIMFECDADESVLKAKSICKNNIFSGKEISDFRIIHNALNYKLEKHGEFGLVAYVDGKDYSFIILPNPDDILIELNSDFENKIITPADALNKLKIVIDYLVGWNDIIKIINEPDKLADQILLTDICARISSAVCQ